MNCSGYTLKQCTRLSFSFCFDGFEGTKVGSFENEWTVNDLFSNHDGFLHVSCLGYTILLINSYNLFLSRFRILLWARMSRSQPVKHSSVGRRGQLQSIRASASEISPIHGRTALHSTQSSIATGRFILQSYNFFLGCALIFTTFSVRLFTALVVVYHYK